jgi:hypothetical protein
LDGVSLELNSFACTLDGLTAENGTAGGIWITGKSSVAISSFGITGTTSSSYGISVGDARLTDVFLFATDAVTITGTKADLQLAGAAGGGYCYAPWTTLTNLVFGELKDCAGNRLVGGINAASHAGGFPIGCNAGLIGRVVALKNTTGAAVAQWTLVTEGGASNIFIPKADTNAHAAGLPMVMLTPALANNDWCLCALEVMRAPVIFDAAPAQGVVAYMSTANAGQVQATIPALAATNQKFRLGITTRNSSGASVNCLDFRPELFPTLADGNI